MCCARKSDMCPHGLGTGCDELPVPMQPAGFSGHIVMAGRTEAVTVCECGMGAGAGTALAYHKELT